VVAPWGTNSVTAETEPLHWRRHLGAGSPLDDFVNGFARVRTWMPLARRDIEIRYRRSMIGPFWISISMGVMVLSLAYLYGGVFGQGPQQYRSYLSFVACGFLAWGFINALVQDGCFSIIESEAYLRNVSLPLTLIASRVVFRQLVYFFHNLVVILPIVFFFGVGLKLTWFELGWAILLYVIAGLAVSLILGPLCARFRDLPQLVSNVMQLFFFLTPIFWLPELSPQRAILVEPNPMYHFLEVMRGPILGSGIPETSLTIVLVWIAVLWSIAIGVFLWSRRQIYFWL
jgi:ABC-2 type transport system permease protein